MALIVACAIGFIWFDGAARWTVIAVGGVIEVVEAALMLWWSQRRTPDTGHESLVGRVAVVIEDLDPAGRVRIDGEIWNAHAAVTCPVGGQVRILSVRGLDLFVEQVERQSETTTQD